MTYAAQLSLGGQLEDRPDRRPPHPIVIERWVVATETPGRMTFLCRGYRDDPAVTTDLKAAEDFASHEAAEEARARYVERHENAPHGLKGWRVLFATTLTAFH